MTFPSDIPNKAGQQLLLSSAEVSKRLKVSAKSIYKWMDEGKFPQSIRLGHMHRWRESDIESWLERGGSDVSSSS